MGLGRLLSLAVLAALALLSAAEDASILAAASPAPPPKAAGAAAAVKAGAAKAGAAKGKLPAAPKGKDAVPKSKEAAPKADKKSQSEAERASKDISELSHAIIERVRKASKGLQDEVHEDVQRAIASIKASFHVAESDVAAMAPAKPKPAAAAKKAAAAAAKKGAAPAAAPKAKGAAFLEMDMEAEAGADMEMEVDAERSTLALEDAETLHRIGRELEADLAQLGESEEAETVEENQSPRFAEVAAPPIPGANKLAAAAATAAAKGAVSKAASSAGKAGLRGKKDAAPSAEGGLVIRPAPDQPEGPITIRRRDGPFGNPSFVKAVAAAHSWEEDLRALLKEVDASNDKVKTLRVRLAEKQNFLESLEKRVSLIKADIDSDKSTHDILKDHIRGLEARVSRLKKQRLKAELDAQRNQYAAAAKKLMSEVQAVNSVADALAAKEAELARDVEPLVKTEREGLEGSLGVRHNRNQAGAPAAAAAPAAKPAAK